MEQARQYAARAVCGGCRKRTLSAYEVNKEGPNRGRLFIKCRHCGHFDWLTAAAAPDEELERVQANARPCPRCGKGRRAQRVRKEGPNKGRLFLVCADPACDSFEWASPAAQARLEQAPRPAPTEGQRTEEGLLADIRDNPEDDAPRLIYADWLDEHAQPVRAELIRVQVERDRLAEGDPARAALEQRSRAILDAHGSGNAITNEGAEALARSPLLSRLRRLDLSGCQVSERGVYLLRQSPLAGKDLVVRR